MRRAPISLLCAAAAASGAALASAPQPTRPAPASLYSGRWYEVARTPNSRENGCVQAYSDFSGMTGQSFQVTQTCVRRSGGAWVNRTGASMVAGSGNAKFKLGFLGGLIRQEYWILDISPERDWAILATPGGHYVWLLARRPALPAPARAAAFARIANLGYPTGTLQSG